MSSDEKVNEAADSKKRTLPTEDVSDEHGSVIHGYNGSVDDVLNDGLIKNEENEKLKKFKTDFTTLTHAVFMQVAEVWEEQWCGRDKFSATFKFEADSMTAILAFVEGGNVLAEVEYSVAAPLADVVMACPNLEKKE